MDSFLIVTADGVQGIVWADYTDEAQDMAEAELMEAGRTEPCSVMLLPRHNRLFDEVYR